MQLPATLHKGLHVTTLRSAAGDTTLNGISARHDNLTIVAILTIDGVQRYHVRPLPRLAQVFDATPKSPAAFLVRREFSSSGPLFHVAPAVADPQLITSFMFGGNAAHPSDGRLNELIPFYGSLNIHDRHEGARGNVYADHEGGDGWCAWSGTLVLDRLPSRRCPAGHPTGQTPAPRPAGPINGALTGPPTTAA